MNSQNRFTAIYNRIFRSLQVTRLEFESDLAAVFSPNKNRILATACWSFPIYSQTFVYQELKQLIKTGFDLRFIYSHLESKKNFSVQFNPIWNVRRRMFLHPKVCSRDLAYYSERMPEKIESLVRKICEASGVTPADLKNHHHFYEAFAFVRLVEAYRPHYLHSYFFYEGTFFTLFASYLLDIPRGVSCYADHMLNDYEFKMVPLHLEQCSLVVATSAQIKHELQTIAPHANPNRIIVKPNAIDSSSFPVSVREEPSSTEPLRIVSVCRIEPKKGLVYLVEAVRILQDKGLPVHVHHVGGGDHQEYFEQLQTKIKELKVSDIFHLEGSQSQAEILNFFKKSHIFVAPFVETETGDKDGIPTSLLEGMSSGLPVVATNAGSILEVVENGREGMIVPQRNAQALADAIESLLKDRQKRELFGNNAAKRVRASFDVSVCERDLHERLKSILKTKPAASAFELEKL
jgi:glycosyltransferase involved in cell wall biosynthesis